MIKLLMESVKFYCGRKPENGEIVQVIFTSRHEDHTEGHLTEYDGDIIMVHSQATSKKKIRSINKLIPLNKPLAATLEDFDTSKGNGSVSRAYLKDCLENYGQKFASNHKLYNGIYQICQHNKWDFKNIWEEIIFPYISNFELDENTYLDLFIKNLNNLDEVIENKELLEKIIDKFNCVPVKKEVFKKKIGIISNNGIESTKSLFEDSLNDPSLSEHKENIKITYVYTPDFMIETDSSETVLNDFVKLVQDNSKKITNTFVKVY